MKDEEWMLEWIDGCLNEMNKCLVGWLVGWLVACLTGRLLAELTWLVAGEDRIRLSIC